MLKNKYYYYSSAFALFCLQSSGKFVWASWWVSSLYNMQSSQSKCVSSQRACRLSRNRCDQHGFMNDLHSIQESHSSHQPRNQFVGGSKLASILGQQLINGYPLQSSLTKLRLCEQAGQPHWQISMWWVQRQLIMNQAPPTCIALNRLIWCRLANPVGLHVNRTWIRLPL